MDDDDDDDDDDADAEVDSGKDILEVDGGMVCCSFSFRSSFKNVFNCAAGTIHSINTPNESFNVLAGNAFDNRAPV